MIASSSPALELRSTVSLPFPQHFRVKPIITQPTITACGCHQLYYPVGFLITIAAAVGTSMRPFMTDLEGGVILGNISVLLLLWSVVTLTHVDRRLFISLLQSFEWWFLLGNVIAYVSAWLLQHADVGAVCTAVITVLGCLYSISLDALASTSRPGKGAVLTVMLIVFTVNYVSLLSAAEDKSRKLLFGYTTASVRKLCLNTLCTFLVKYIAVLIFRPHRLQLIRTTIKTEFGPAVESLSNTSMQPTPTTSNSLNERLL